MTPDEERPPAPREDGNEPPKPAEGSEIKVEKLAERVYQLLLAEARLSRARHDY